jgi:hypothetical protein
MESCLNLFISPAKQSCATSLQCDKPTSTADTQNLAMATSFV